MKLIRDATILFGALEEGELAAEASRQITSALATLKEQCGGRAKVKAKGKVVITLDLEVEAGTVTITGDITAKVPKPARGSSFYWVKDDGTLSTEHPQQMSMFGGPEEVRSRAFSD